MEPRNRIFAKLTRTLPGGITSSLTVEIPIGADQNPEWFAKHFPGWYVLAIATDYF